MTGLGESVGLITASYLSSIAFHLNTRYSQLLKHSLSNFKHKNNVHTSIRKLKNTIEKNTEKQNMFEHQTCNSQL